MVARILVGFRHDPGGRVGDTEVEDFAGGDEIVEAEHDFFDRGRVVPPVDVEDVDVAGLEFLETGLDADAHRFAAVAHGRGVQLAVEALVGSKGGRVFGCDDHLVADAARGKPFAEPLLGLLRLVVIRRVHEISPPGVEVIEHGQSYVLVAQAHDFGPEIWRLAGLEGY